MADELEADLASSGGAMSTTRAVSLLGLGEEDADGEFVIRTSVLPLVTNVNKYIIDQLISGGGYDSGQRPFVGLNLDSNPAYEPWLPVAVPLPVPITVSFLMQNLKVVNDHIYFKGILRSSWQDERLSYDAIVPHRGRPPNVYFPQTSDVWTPDMYALP